ncbi:MAG: xylanase [Lachnospiraceae bacterium]|nr:xylanase [Lachnospiraceae bacterium]
MTAACLNGMFTNYFEKAGYPADEIERRLSDIFDTLFYGSEDEKIYHETGDMGYIVDTGNIDARTEGMSYGMMMCVQLDHKEEFDRIWKWARTNMYLSEGRNQGFFCWSNALDGSKNSDGPAPDGEEYFAAALLFASHRWGDGEGIFEYSREACDILHNMIREADGTRGRGMFDRENHLIRFVPEVDFTDPSYHLPHFYELFSQWAYPEDRTFFAKAASASRQYLHKACHELSGLCAEYSYYDGTPYEKGGEIWGKHDWYYSDAYRTIMNIALDHVWFCKDEWQEIEGSRFINCMCRKVGEDNWGKVLDWDGTVRSEDVLHPTAVIATNAAAYALVSDEESDDVLKLNAKKCLAKFWDTPLRQGERRYYDNCLYLFAFLLLSGRYRIW